MNNSLRIQRDRLALEAMSGADIKALLTKGFPNFIGEVKGFINHFSPNDSGIKMSSKQHEFMRELGKHAYLDIEPLVAYVPEGLDVTYLDYAEKLEGAVEHASKVLSGPLSTYSVFLAQLISNKDSRISSLTNAKFHRELAATRLEANDEVGRCFSKGSTKTESNFGNVTRRNSDWPNVFQALDNFARQINNVDRKVMNKKITECVTLLEKVQDLIKRGEFDDLSPQAFENLSSGAYEIASELEFFAAMYYKVETFSNAINRTMQHFHDVFKQN